MKKLIKLFTSPNSIPIIITKNFTIIPFMKKSKTKIVESNDLLFLEQ